MNSRRIGSLSVSVVGLGCNNFGWRLDAAATADVVHAALDAGINFLDTADMYGEGRSEEYIGAAIKGRRDDVVIATKFGKPVGGRKAGADAAYIQKSVESSLRRLGTDRIDLYQLHEPHPDVPIMDTLSALHALVRAGKIREIGCSNFTVDQLREAEAVSKGATLRHFVSVQNEYSLFHRDPEQDVLPECERMGVAFLPYFPLASGLLTGKYRLGKPTPAGRLARGERATSPLTERNLHIVEDLIEFAEQRDRSVLELAFGWLLHRPAVASVIAGATSPQQVRANAAAAGWVLTEREMTEIDTIVPKR